MIASAVYMAAVSLVSAVAAIADKIRAKRGARRIPERTLVFLAALGGAPTMFLTMIVIRHKTKKPLFMISLPLLTVAHFILFLLLLKYVF